MDLFITNRQNHLFKITLEFLENLEEMIHRHRLHTDVCRGIKSPIRFERIDLVYKFIFIIQII